LTLLRPLLGSSVCEAFGFIGLVGRSAALWLRERQLRAPRHRMMGCKEAAPGTADTMMAARAALVGAPGATAADSPQTPTRAD
jgi:hypothetical protein